MIECGVALDADRHRVRRTLAGQRAALEVLEPGFTPLSTDGWIEIAITVPLTVM
jgi:hypothetical protein